MDGDWWPRSVSLAKRQGETQFTVREYPPPPSVKFNCMPPHRFIVAQLGARMHYAVPRILAEADMLEHFYTDICAVQGWPRWLGLVPDPVRPAAMRRLLARVPHGVPKELITAFTDFGREYARRCNTAAAERFAVYLWAGTEFCRRILQKGFGGAGAVFT